MGLDLKCPDGTSPHNEIQLDEFAASTRAHHGGAPEVAVLAHDIDLASARLRWQIVNHNPAVPCPIPSENLAQPQPALLDHVTHLARSEARHVEGRIRITAPYRSARAR